ncbi:interleukin 12 receptor, beta 2a, like isoform X2 [Esox lucius]|nr:interleukin 12 receptor, beta 2a, like isoform X2 [Esox lucius]
MAWTGVSCLLMLLLHTGLPKPGNPPPPSTPQCYIPYATLVDILCSWDPGSDPQIPTSYTMYWQSGDWTDSVEGTNVSGVIPRDRYSKYSDLEVWVKAVNKLGNVTSEKASFNTGDIMKPPAPEIFKHSHQPLEIFWRIDCLELVSLKECEVQYRTQDQQDWTQEEESLLKSYSLQTPQPNTLYEFQVRCACECNCAESMMSDWSSTYTARSYEAAPVKALDVWSDCGVTSELSQCGLMWKELPIQFARGEVLGYMVTLLYSNGTKKDENVLLTMNGDRLVSQEKIWRFTPSLQGVLGGDVSAYNSQGASEHAHHALPTSCKGLPVSELSFTVNMTLWSLNVSWFLPNQPIENIQEFVVQYNKAGIFPTAGFEWIKVDRNLMSVILRGHFENFTAYNVSLYAVFNNSSCLLASKIAYSISGLPPKVRDFQSQIDGNVVTVSWQHNLLNESKGHILYYQLILDNSTVHNVSGNQTSFVFSGLTSGHHHVWIRAATEAGLEPSGSINFFYLETDGIFYTLWLIILVLLTLLFLFLLIWCIKEKLCFQVPDPINSKLFQQKIPEFNSSWTGNCNSVEYNPKISELEVVEKPLWDAKASPKEMSNSDRLIGDRTHTRRNGERHEEVHADPGDYRDKDLQQTEGRRENRREGYRKMIDTYKDERDWEESLSEDDQFVSDYEKHYMPGNV